MFKRVGMAALWSAAGFLLGAAALAGGQGDEDLRNKLIEIESLCGQLRALDAEPAGFPAANEQGLEVDCVHVADVTLGVTEFVRPRHIDWDAEQALYSGPVEEAPQPYGTIEEIIELVRTHVRPQAWEEGATMSTLGPTLLLFAPPDVNRAVHAYFDNELRPAARRMVNLELEIVEVDEPLAAELTAAAGGELDPDLRARLEEAIGATKARLVFGGRVLALSRQQVVLWHGAEAATLPHADVEVSIRSEAADPDVDVDLLGTIAEARSTVGDDPTRVRIQIDLGHDALDLPIRTVKTEKTGTLQMPARTTMEVTADLWTTSDRWAVAAGHTGPDGKRLFLLVRPTVI